MPTQLIIELSMYKDGSLHHAIHPQHYLPNGILFSSKVEHIFNSLEPGYCPKTLLDSA